MNEAVAIEIPEARYAVFDAMRDGLPEIISINEALLSFPHNQIFPWHLVISIKAEALANNGMPTPEESRLLFEVTDKLEDVVTGGVTADGSGNALFLARSTWNGWRELVFYVHDPEITHVALQACLEDGDHLRHWEYRMEADAEWLRAGHLFQLFSSPDGKDLQ